MKLLVDMNLSPRWIPFLLDAGCEAVHWSTVGKPGATDSEIMAFAAANDYVVLTNDLDFAAILASTHHKKPSVVQIRAEDLDPNVIGTRIVAALQSALKDLEGGALLTIEADRIRDASSPRSISGLLPVRPKTAAYSDFSALRRQIFGRKKVRKTGTDLASEGWGALLIAYADTGFLVSLFT